jgi:D-amino peptidase
MEVAVIRSSTRVLFAVGLLLGCGPGGSGEGAATGGGTAAPPEPWTITEVRPDTADGLRILLLHDMEGLAGQSDPRTFFFGTAEYPRGQELLVGDINAVVDGLFAGGATEVQVVDGHGSGNPDPDVRRDLLDPRATQVLRDSAFDQYSDLVAPGAYDGVAVVGMHAKTGSGGFASHTYTIGIEFLVNGRTITETELVALLWGPAGVPVIFGSGDDRLARDLATMPWVEFVTVKTARGADSADPRPLAEARADLTASARRAAENLRAGRTSAMRMTAPAQAALRAVPPADLSYLEGVPGIDYADGAVRFQAPDFATAYRGFKRLVGAARHAYGNLLVDEARAAGPPGVAILDRYRVSLRHRWFDVESGRWRPPAADSPAPRKHHGAR